MTFIVKAACDCGDGKLNTGIDFSSRPNSLSELISVIEALYTAELQAHQNDPNVKFQCVACLVLVGDDSSTGTWREVTSIDQIENGDQLFVFDWGAPPPNRGPIPSVQFVVSSHQILRAAKNTATTVAPQNYEPQQPPRAPPGVVQTPKPRLPPPKPGDTQTTFNVFSNRRATEKSVLPTEAHDFLFHQLVTASSVDGPDGTISGSILHRIFVDNGMGFSTEEFSYITNSQHTLDRKQWNHIVTEFAPVIDALYDRLATRSAARETERQRRADGRNFRDLSMLRGEYAMLEEEEASLLARHAALRHRLAEVSREMREVEAFQNQLDPSQNEDRQREWDTLQKFVSLRVRQMKLRNEEAQVSHQLSLL